jgi:hypothetical protein
LSSRDPPPFTRPSPLGSANKGAKTNIKKKQKTKHPTAAQSGNADFFTPQL